MSFLDFLFLLGVFILVGFLMWDGNYKRQVWLWMFKAIMSFIMISQTSNFKRVLKHAMTKLIPKRKWKCVTILVKQTVNYWSWNPLPLLLSKYKRNCAQRKSKNCKQSKAKIKLHQLIFWPLTISLAMAFGGNHKQLEQSDI